MKHRTSNYHGENLRCLLWREEVARDGWARQLEDWLGCYPPRAEDLLTGTKPLSEGEARRIAEKCPSVDAESLIMTRLLDSWKINVLQANISHLIECLSEPGRGGKAKLAKALGVDPGTISHWLAGRQGVRRQHQTRLKEIAGVPPGTDLATDPLFLELMPPSTSAQRLWLRERAAQVPEDRIRRLFPALYDLLK